MASLPAASLAAESAARSRPTVVVVGSGLAGLSATIEAARAGANVFLLDKNRMIGGNSAKATSGMNAAPTATQAARGVPDTLALFTDDVLRSGAGLSDAGLVDELVQASVEAFEFVESFGVELSVVSRCGGHSLARTHREADRLDGRPTPIGFDIVSALRRHVESRLQAGDADSDAPLADAAQCPVPGAVKVMLGARVTELLVDASARVRGVSFVRGDATETLEADAVILATGGFCSDRDGFLARFAPELAAFPTTNGPWATGDGVRLAVRVGADTVHMDKVQLHPTGFVDPSAPSEPTKFLAPESLRAHGAILLNERGARFVNELATRQHVSDSILEHCPTRVAFMVMTEATLQDFGMAAAKFYIGKRLIQRFDNIDALASHFGLDAATVLATLKEHNAAAADGVDSFGKTVFPVLFHPRQTLYVSQITPSLHYTMGGLRFNRDAQILDERGAPIAGLFGAGEVTGGLHGNNRLAGNSLLECVVFGRIAGASAVRSSL